MDSGLQTTAYGRSQPYMNPYLAGAAIGLVLLASFVIMGRGLGASGAFASFTSYVVNLVSPEHTAGNGFYEKYLDPDRAPHPLKDWLVFEVIGVLIGGFLSGILSGRVKKVIEKGPRISNAGRLALAFAGGALMAFGAQLGRGCTSGQALTGGSLLNLGSWMFMISIFIGGYATAYFMRREWR